MSRSSSQVISPMAAPVSGAAASLHPVLQAALENLDVQLEEELTRYRRQQRLQSHSVRRTPGFAGAKSPQSSADLQLPQFAAVPIAASAPDSGEPIAEPETAVAVPMSATAIAPESILQGETSALAVPSAEPAQPVPEANLAARSPQSPIVPAAVPDDYFASSEELLRSIAEEAPEERAVQSNLLETLLTPLGIGSLLLLLLSTATLGYLVMNPASLGFFAAQKPAPNAGSANPARPAAPEAIEPPAPNLAAKEFVELNLDTLSTIPKPSPAVPSKPSPSPSPQTASKPLEPLVPPATSLSPLPEVRVPAQPAIVAPANSRSAASGRSTAAEPAPSYEPVQSSPTAARPATAAPAGLGSGSEPAPRSESRTPAVAASSSAFPRPNYLVVTPYRSDADLNQVQQTVPDAYVRNFSDGATVQMGAFSDESKAEELVQELQQQGIQAEVRERR